jgi:hypothetical protein
VTSLGGAALAQQPASGRGAIELGARVGFGVPFGNRGRIPTDTTDPKLSDYASAVFPIWFDAGYRINPNIYVGLYFQYGFGFVNTDTYPGCDQSGVSCSVSDKRLGANVLYHFSPGQRFDPWIGFGAGYEWSDFSATGGGLTISASASGYEFANLQLGGDFVASRIFNCGPFMSFSLGQFQEVSSGGTSVDITNKSLHQWLLFGFKGAFSIGI